MRTIHLKYAGECRKCGAALSVGTQAAYERRIGVFCLACAPDGEELRAYRQERADRKADRLESWAAKRRQRAGAVLEHNRTYTSDYAFNTQPGRFPLRERVIRQNDKAYESLRVADDMQAKADRLRAGVRVAGDRERSRQAARDAIRPKLRPGMLVDTGLYGQCRIVRVNRKTVTVRWKTHGTFTLKVDLSWIRIVEERFALIVREGERKHYVCPHTYDTREAAEAHLRESHAALVETVGRAAVPMSIGVEPVNPDEDSDVWRSFDGCA